MTQRKVKIRLPLYGYRLFQDGSQVAEVTASTQKEAEREIKHYIMMYEQDGPVEIRAYTRRGK